MRFGHECGGDDDDDNEAFDDDDDLWKFACLYKVTINLQEI